MILRLLLSTAARARTSQAPCKTGAKNCYVHFNALTYSKQPFQSTSSALGTIVGASPAPVALFPACGASTEATGAL